MSSLLPVMLFTIVCLSIPQLATAQNQSRYAPRQARTQIAFKDPSANSINNVQQVNPNPNSNLNPNPNPNPVPNPDPNPKLTPAWSNDSFDYSNGVSPSGTRSGDTWSGEQSGITNAYNYSQSFTSQGGGEGGYGRGYDRVYDTYAMSGSDVLAARRAILTGSFFSYHGTQSSQVSRNR